MIIIQTWHVHKGRKWPYLLESKEMGVSHNVPYDRDEFVRLAPAKFPKKGAFVKLSLPKVGWLHAVVRGSHPDKNAVEIECENGLKGQIDKVLDHSGSSGAVMNRTLKKSTEAAYKESRESRVWSWHAATKPNRMCLFVRCSRGKCGKFRKVDPQSAERLTQNFGISPDVSVGWKCGDSKVKAHEDPNLSHLCTMPDTTLAERDKLTQASFSLTEAPAVATQPTLLRDTHINLDATAANMRAVKAR